MKSLAFDRVIGIDWSGADGKYQAGIRVADIRSDTNQLRLLKAPGGANWTRDCVLDLIAATADIRTLIGIDFAFSLPWNQELESLTTSSGALGGVRRLWTFIDDLCKDELFLHARPVWLSELSPFRPFIKFWSRSSQYEGDLFGGGQFRKTEIAAKAGGLQPKSVYRMVGPQVGAGSFAGMRMLNRVSQIPNLSVAIWPFDEIGSASVVVAEIYPAVFYHLAGQKRPTPRQIKTGLHASVTRDVLKFFKTDYEERIPNSIDAIDALISAAALSHLSKRYDSFPIFDDVDVSGKEGWILGVPYGDQAQ